MAKPVALRELCEGRRSLAIALLALVSFGCATVRAPVSALGDESSSDATANTESQLELWLESSDPISSDEKIDAGQQARESLAWALEQHPISAHALDASDALLFIRERAVARTSSRKSSQTAAVVGMVVGVVVVAVVAVASRGKGSSSGHGSLGHGSSPHASVGHAAPTAPLSATGAHAGAVGSAAAAHGTLGRAPAAIAGPVAPVARQTGTGSPAGPPHASPVGAPRPARPHRPAPPAPYFYPTGPLIEAAPIDPWFDLGFELWLHQEPLLLAPGDEVAPPDEGASDAAPPEAPLAAPPPDEAASAEQPSPADPAPPPPPPPLQLPPPADFSPEQRGFFDGDDTQLELDLFDRASGELLWSEVVRDEIDPRDRGALEQLLGKALRGQPWAGPRALGP